MKNLIFKIIIAGLVFYLVIALSGLRFNDNDASEEFINFCNNTSSSIEMLECVEANKLTPQQQYNIYYNRSDSYSDGKFYVGFNLSYNQCSIDKNCNLYDKDRFIQMYQRCIKNNESECVEVYLKNKVLSSEDALLLSQTLNKNLVKVEDNSMCLQFSDIYHNFSKEDQTIINKQIVDKCRW